MNNTGDANFTDVEVTDLKLDSLVLIPDANSSDNALNVSETWVYVGTYNVTEEDGCIGWVNNTASVNATTLCETGAFYSNNVSIRVDYNASFNITKAANRTGPVSPGDLIEYTIEVCNTGNLSLKEVTVFDNRTGSYYVGNLGKGSCNESKRVYQVTEQDLCNGSVTNDAYATALDYCNKPLSTETNASVRLEVDYNSSISIEKVANVTGPVSPGDLIEYTIEVCNTGNLSLKEVTVFDNRTGSYYVGNLGKGSCNESKRVYQVTEQDLCNGSVTNDAYATALDYCNKPLSTETNASVRLEVDYNSSISIEKVANVTGPVSPGDLIEYTIEVCNTGNLSLKEVTVFDNRTGSYYVGNLGKGSCNESKRVYQVTEQDLCNGSVTNDAYATALDYCNKPLSTETNASVRLEVDYNSSISIEKVANVTGPVSPGDLIEYTIEVCNTGNLSLKEVTVFDNRTGSYYVGNLGKGSCNESKRVYQVTEQDLCKDIVNNATVSAYDPCGKEVNDTDYNIVFTVCAYCISGHKYWDKDGDSIKDPEDPPVKNWTILVRNESGSFIETKTNETGYWEVCDLIPGIYNVSEEVKDGWKPTDPPSGFYDSIEVESFNVTGIDFLNTGTLCISGHKYWDKDGNGVKDPMDEPLANWTIFIHEYGDEIADPRKPVTTTTGGDGSWKICNLPPGSYTVCEEPKAGWTQTYPEGSGCYSVEIIDESVSGLDFFNSKPLFKGLNLDEIAIGDQNALGFWGGDAINALTIEKDQQAGMVYQKIIPAEDCGCLGPNRLYWNTTVLNIERIDAGNQSASAGGDATGTNRIKVGSSQRTAEGCDC